MIAPEEMAFIVEAVLFDVLIKTILEIDVTIFIPC